MENNIKPYPTYKTIDLSWLNQLPLEWDIKRCAVLFNEKKLLNKDYLFKKAFQFKFGEIVDKKQAGTEDELKETYQKYTIVEKDDIVVNGLNLNYDFLTQRVGKVRESGIITSAYISISPQKQKIDPQFASYLLKTIDNKKMLNGMGTGIRLTLSFPELKKQYLPLPPLSEQTQIANFLDYKLALINKFIKDKKLEIKLLKEQKQAEINQAVTRGVNPNAKMKDSGIEWIGEIPEHWEVNQLKKLLILQRGHDLTNSEFIEGSYPVYGSNGIIGYHNRYTTSGPNITIGRSGSVGKLNYVSEKFWAHNTCIYVKDLKNNNCKYLYYLLSNLDMDLLATKTAVPTLDRKNIQRVSIPFTSIKVEQQQIVDYITLIENRIETAIKAIENQIKLIQEYKISLISDVVTGKVDVRNVAVEKIEDIPEEEIEETEDLENSEEKY